MPPNPKHQSARVNRTKRSTRATLYEVDPAEIEIPELPKRYDKDNAEIPWRMETQEWWEAIWGSPMSTEFHTSDTHGLYRLAVLVDEYWRRPTVGLSGEIRLLQQSYGLTPLDRRRLEWTIEQSETAKDRGDKRRTARIGAVQPTGNEDDPRTQALA